MKIDFSDILNHFYEQFDLLKIFCEGYDSGHEMVALQIATSIRVLCHDTAKSQSLLHIMNLKSCYFYDTSNDWNPKNLIYFSGLTQIACDGNGLHHCPAFERRADGVIKWVDFDSWWNKIIIVDEKRNTHSRKELILCVCNKDGGAHIDLDLNEKYYNLTRTNMSGWYINGDKSQPMPGDISRASVRQIGFEVTKTLEKK